ncbi:hypothetical protein RJ640_001634 [Escallonia rubra]|uniref:Nucleolar protein 10 n=1 Tax=Escallonia rubra TaxID=112253 RepID=A0AA88QU54_9ASTE|nr:hypothetical protein RJ640_001634 [Escallonia rubra]
MVCSESERKEMGCGLWVGWWSSVVGPRNGGRGSARFSPDDKYSRQRVLLKKRFGLLPTQKPPLKY